MRRVSNALMLTGTLLMLGAMGPRTMAETGTEEDPKLLSDSIVVTANRFELQPRLSVWPITAVRLSRIEGEESLESVLDGSAGADIRQYSGVGSASTWSNWGMFNRHMLLLYDGRVVKDYSLGGFNLSEYSPDEFDRIEILKGPQSAIYGADAVGGVVNLLTRSSLVDRLTMRAKYGTYAHWQVRMDAAKALGTSGFGVGGFAEITEADNARDNAGVERKLFGLRSDFLSDDGRHSLSISGRYFTDSVGVPGPVPDPLVQPVYGSGEATSLYDHQQDENYSADLSYQFRDDLIGEFRADMFWEKKNLDYRRKYQYFSDEYDIDRSIYNKRSSGLSGRFLKQLTGVDASAGIDWLSGSLRGTSDRRHFDAETNDQVADFYDFWMGSQDQLDVWTAASFMPADELRFTVGGRLQFVKDRDTQDSYNLGLVVLPTDHLTYKLGYGYAFRHPTLSEQFGGSVYTAGNPTLGPETSRSLNLTAEYVSLAEDVEVGATFFRQTVDSLVQYNYDPVRFLSIPRNVEGFKTVGLDAHIGIQAGERIHLEWAVVYQNAEQTAESGRVAVSANYVPEIKWRADIDGTPQERVTVNLNVTYTSDRGIVMYGDVPKTIDKVYELGASVSCRLNHHFKITLTGYDLTDEARPDQFGFSPADGDYPSPGRRLVLDIAYSIL